MLVEDQRKLSIEELKDIAIQVRLNIIEMITEAQAGHPGGSLSATDIVTALYFRLMRIDPTNPECPPRSCDLYPRAALSSAVQNRCWPP